MTLERVKAAFAFAGLAAAVAGVVVGNRIVVWVAIGLLVGAVIVRMVERRQRERAEQERPQVESHD